MIQAVRGMNDTLPQETFIWQSVEKILKQILRSYGYQEIRTPILEKTELFKRSIGEVTDIVEKEMYTFLDRNDESLSLRPEGTAGCVRAGIEHGLLYNQIQRLWYLGPYFRHERPQKGRYRQFHQCGVEAFGMKGPEIDAELILLSAFIFRELGLSEHVTLELNSLGSLESRSAYRKILVDYFTKHHDQLDEDSQRRLHTNPLRILDSKNPNLQNIIKEAPKLSDHLDEESKEHFNQLKFFLKQAGITYHLNSCLVRGLDYYTKTVFEWTTNELGAQSAICSGGRYDGLVEQLGGKPTWGLGFGIGMERLILLLQKVKPETIPSPDVYIISENQTAFTEALLLSANLRKQLPNLSMILHCGGGSLKNQFKKASDSHAKVILILKEEELKSQSLKIKRLKENSPEEILKMDLLVDYLKKLSLFV